jgi:hypothetical protein
MTCPFCALRCRCARSRATSFGIRSFSDVFLCIKGYWWGLVFLPFLALDLWLLRSLLSYARRAR